MVFILMMRIILIYLGEHKEYFGNRKFFREKCDYMKYDDVLGSILDHTHIYLEDLAF